MIHVCIEEGTIVRGGDEAVLRARIPAEHSSPIDIRMIDRLIDEWKDAVVIVHSTRPCAEESNDGANDLARVLRM